jgi:hypothetical protein
VWRKTFCGYIRLGASKLRTFKCICMYGLVCTHNIIHVPNICYIHTPCLGIKIRRKSKVHNNTTVYMCILRSIHETGNIPSMVRLVLKINSDSELVAALDKHLIDYEAIGVSNTYM